MCHISRKVITHFFQFSHLGYRPTVYRVRDVVGPYPCEHWQLDPREGLVVVSQLQPPLCRRWQLTRADLGEGCSVAKVHVDIDLPH
jgi:hypothetical protein